MSYFREFNKPTLYDEGIIVSASNSVEPTVDTESEIKRLKDALTAELNNRCCGNCYYFLVHLTWQGRPNTICVNEKSDVIYREKCSPACDHWRSCRG